MIKIRPFSRTNYRCLKCGSCKASPCNICGSSQVEANETTGLTVDIRVRMPDGTMFRERTKSPVSGKAATDRWAQAREREILTRGMAPKPPTPKPKLITLTEFWPRFWTEHVLANKQKASGRESKEYGFRKFLKPHLGALPLDEITTPKVTALKSAMVSEDYAAGTINNTLALLAKVLKFGVDVGLIPAVPCRIQKLKKQAPATRAYEREEYERLVSAAEKLGPQHHLLILLAGDAGLRKGELAGLLQRHCDTRRGLITVQQSDWHGTIDATKGMAVRHIPMTDRLREALKKNRHLKGERVFMHDDRRPVTANTLRRWAEQAQRAAGFPRATGALHILRHSFCTHAVAAGVPVTTVQRLAGHQSITTTTRYLHALEGETDRAIRLLQESRGR